MLNFRILSRPRTKDVKRLLRTFSVCTVLKTITPIDSERERHLSFKTKVHNCKLHLCESDQNDCCCKGSCLQTSQFGHIVKVIHRYFHLELLLNMKPSSFQINTSQSAVKQPLQMFQSCLTVGGLLYWQQQFTHNSSFPLC